MITSKQCGVDVNVPGNAKLIVREAITLKPQSVDDVSGLMSTMNIAYFDDLVFYYMLSQFDFKACLVKSISVFMFIF